MYGAVAAGAAAGGYDTIVEAAARMAASGMRPTGRTPPTAVYDELYAEYRALHDYFGRGANDVMKRLKAMRARALSGAIPARVAEG